MEINFWLESPSIHQAGLVRALCEIEGTNVRVVAAAHNSESRKSLGWSQGDFGVADLVIGPTERERRAIEDACSADAIHIVTGVFSYPPIADTTRRLLRRGSYVICQTEGWDSSGVRGWFRNLRFRSRLKRLSRYPRSAILAMGDNGYSNVIDSQFPTARVCQFAYFVQPEIFSSKADRAGVVFVGALTPRKGLDFLIPAMRDGVGPKLTIVGAGADAARYRALAGASERIEFVGTVPNSEIGNVLSSSLALVLPSLHDGWGAVVNEALLAGTPVICTSSAGASCLIGDDPPFRGVVVPSRSQECLREAVNNVAGTDSQPIAYDEIAKWANEHISPKAGAIYLHGICQKVIHDAAVDLSAVVPPWGFE